MLLALLGLDDAAVADLLYVGKAHIGDGGAAVKSAFLFHLQNDVFERFLFVDVKG